MSVFRVAGPVGCGRVPVSRKTPYSESLCLCVETSAGSGLPAMILRGIEVDDNLHRAAKSGLGVNLDEFC